MGKKLRLWIFYSSQDNNFVTVENKSHTCLQDLRSKELEIPAPSKEFAHIFVEMLPTEKKISARWRTKGKKKRVGWAASRRIKVSLSWSTFEGVRHERRIKKEKNSKKKNVEKRKQKKFLSLVTLSSRRRRCLIFYVLIYASEGKAYIQRSQKTTGRDGSFACEAQKTNVKIVEIFIDSINISASNFCASIFLHPEFAYL